ncbi:unnamed protein product [marine sediment metagenome]|uniref:IclR family transcriptional regulator n=1 Tax=marine sediment metagenome TaxID=412755 RepID=X1FR47_9ZZZZ
MKKQHAKSTNNESTSIDQALNILEVFSEKNAKLGVTEISEILEMSISTVHRTLLILKRRGYVEQDSQRGKYKLGLRVFELGCVFQNQVYLIEVAMPHLEHLANLTNETVNLAILDHNQREVVYIAKIDSPEVLKTDIRIGTRLLANCTALGKVLLASLPEREIERIFPKKKELPTYTSSSISTFTKLKEHLREVKSRGFAVDDEEFKTGVRCLGVPIKDTRGKVIAAISITGPAIRFSLEKIEKLKSTIIEVSSRISERIGFKTL